VFSVFSVLKITPNLGKAFNTENTEKFREINHESPNMLPLQLAMGKSNQSRLHQKRIREFTRTNGPGLRFCRSCPLVLRIPSHWGRAPWSHCLFRGSLELEDFSGPVGLFLVALGAPKVEDLGFPWGQFCPVACRLHAGYDCGNGNGCFAMQACHSSESRAFGFKCHFSILAGDRIHVVGDNSSYTKSYGRVQSPENIACRNCGNDWTETEDVALQLASY
jgi:hypothetical protein